MMASSSLHQALVLLVGSVCYYTGGVSGFSPGSTFSFVSRHHTSILPVKSSSFLANTSSNSIMETVRIDYAVKKPMGIILEEREENEASTGVCFIIDESLDYSSAFTAGVRTGDVLVTLNGNDVTSSSFDDVMELFANALSPVDLTVQRVRQQEKKKVVLQPKRMPSTKQVVKASTSANFWKDPLMIGSAVLTIVMPLGIYLAATGPK